MGIDEAEFMRLNKAATDARSQRDRAQGQYDAAVQRLKEDFGCTTLKEAAKKATDLEKEAEEALADYDEAKALFMEAWGENI